MVKKFPTDPSPLWNGYNPKIRFDLPTFVNRWMSEDGIDEEIVFQRMHKLLIHSDVYVIVYENLAIADPHAASFFLKASHGTPLGEMVVPVCNTELLEEYRDPTSSTTIALADKICDSEKKVPLESCFVDCYRLMESFAIFNSANDIELSPPIFVVRRSKNKPFTPPEKKKPIGRPLLSPQAIAILEERFNSGKTQSSLTREIDEISIALHTKYPDDNHASPKTLTNRLRDLYKKID
ncbi:MAG: hypothetical protein HQL69_19230 [Magnetococcales bacterium]|nr:hypothetical protein [Magnetococcales bacterium]